MKIGLLKYLTQSLLKKNRMGIIIFPLYIGAIIIVLKSTLMISKQISNSSFEPIHIIYGVVCMLLIYGLIVLSYVKEKKSWALSPLFRFPIFMIYTPFVILYFIGSDFKQISDSMLVCIIASGLFMILFNGYFFNILDKLGKKKHY